VKTFRILYSCALFLSLSSSISLAEEKNYGLQEVIDIAIEKNPTAAIFKANIEASQGEVVSSKAYPNPEVGRVFCERWSAVRVAQKEGIQEKGCEGRSGGNRARYRGLQPGTAL